MKNTLEKLHTLLSVCSHHRLTWNELLTKMSEVQDIQDAIVRIDGSELSVPISLMSPDTMCSARLRYIPGDDDTVMVSMHNFADAIAALADELTEHGSNDVDFLSMPVCIGTSTEDPDEYAFLTGMEVQDNVIILWPHDDTVNGCYIDDTRIGADYGDDDEEDEDDLFPSTPGKHFNR